MKDNSREKQIIEFLCDTGRATPTKLADVIGESLGVAWVALDALIAAGVVRNSGHDEYFYLTDAVRPQVGEPLPLDADKRLLSELLKLYTEHGWVGRVSLANWLGVDAYRVRELQCTLTRQRMLRLDKNGKYTLVRKRNAA